MSEKARITIDDPDKTFAFPCGCKVAAATRVDGQTGFAIAACEAGADCPSVLFALAEMNRVPGAPPAIVQDFELADEIVGGPPPDHTFDCGCKAVFGIGEDGKKTCFMYACDAGPDCPNTARFIETAREAGAEHPEKTFEVRVLERKH